ncbi:hypothetical protein PybrP1_005631 [[Pythium] brassicae (nom. inval.)]|nr:hypothetical protein PybrP1_005631 [[Pythium] brassicae (nom. inval.)]
MHETDLLLALEEHSKTRYDDAPSTTSSDESGLPWKQRVRAFFVEYGAVGLGVHVVLSLAVIALAYICVSNGVDVSAVLASIGIVDSAKGTAAHSAGAFVIAYAIFKLLAPVRVPLTFAVTPLVMRALRRKGYMLPPAAPPPPTPSLRDESAIDAAAASAAVVQQAVHPPPL